MAVIKALDYVLMTLPPRLSLKYGLLEEFARTVRHSGFHRLMGSDKATFALG